MNENVNVFEVAAKTKMRFPFNGLITAEDLFDLPVEKLDGIFKTLRAEQKKTEEESLLGKKTHQEETLAIKIEVVKQVVTYKLDEKKKREDAAVRRQKKQQIMELIVNKENEAMAGKSLDELNKMLEDLD
jgi:hypothetical protein